MPQGNTSKYSPTVRHEIDVDPCDAFYKRVDTHVAHVEAVITRRMYFGEIKRELERREQWIDDRHFHSAVNQSRRIQPVAFSYRLEWEPKEFELRFDGTFNSETATSVQREVV